MDFSSFFHSMLVNALTPITLISGVGLMMLCMTARFNHSTERIRQLIKKREESGLEKEPVIDREIRLIYRRASYLRRALLFLTLSAASSGLLVAVNVFSHFTGANLVAFSTICLVGALLLIVMSAACFSYEIGLSLHALDMAVTHLLRDYRRAKGDAS